MIMFLMVLFLGLCIVSILINTIKERFIPIILSILILVVGFWFAIQADQEGYKRGQVDAINGKIKYEFKVEVDSTYIKKE